MHLELLVPDRRERLFADLALVDPLAVQLEHAVRVRLAVAVRRRETLAVEQVDADGAGIVDRFALEELHLDRDVLAHDGHGRTRAAAVGRQERESERLVERVLEELVHVDLDSGNDVLARVLLGRVELQGDGGKVELADEGLADLVPGVVLRARVLGRKGGPVAAPCFFFVSNVMRLVAFRRLTRRQRGLPSARPSWRAVR